MQVSTNLVLDLQRPNINAIVHAKQNDKASRSVVAKLMSGESAFMPPNGANYMIRYGKSDGTGGMYDKIEDGETAAVTVSQNTATIRLAEQALTAPGPVVMEMNIYDSTGAKLTTFSWIVFVEESAFSDEEIVSTNYFNILTEEIALAVQAGNVAQQALDTVPEAAQTATQALADIQALAATIVGNVGIDDTATRTTTTWSSQKIDGELGEIRDDLAEVGELIGADYIITSNNFIDTNDLIDGYYFDGGGNILESANSVMTKKIPIEPNTLYWHDWGNLAIYAEDDTCLGVYRAWASTGDDRATTTQANASYIRMYTDKSNRDKMVMMVGIRKAYDIYHSIPRFDAEQFGLVVDKNGSGDYTSITKAINDNVGKGYKFFVKSGVYDLLSEYKAEYGNDYFDSNRYTESIHPQFWEGLEINNSFLYLDSGAIIKFDYTSGTNEAVAKNFSPVKFSGVGGEIHGGKIICNNCRYAIHDDVYASSERAKCVMDGIYVKYVSARKVGIGGGLGQNTTTLIQNCYIDSGSGGYGAFYHNATTGNSQNYLTIKDNYFSDSIVIKSYGAATNISNVLVTNNRCHSVDKEISGSNDNMLLTSWNNVVEVIHDSDLNKRDRLVQ